MKKCYCLTALRPDGTCPHRCDPALRPRRGSRNRISTGVRPPPAGLLEWRKVRLAARASGVPQPARGWKDGRK